ncbi:MAG: response regulator [Deltaproteobacteria bacterium]|nr:response regulator [Deltaproteobacteria bacterium]
MNTRRTSRTSTESAPRVLIVDDSLTVRMDLARLLAGAEFAPVPVANLADARLALATRPFALVVLDVLLPDGDGMDLLREIRLGKNHALPVLVLSSEAEVHDRLRGLATGADDYVGKPYDPTYLIARARELSRREPTAEARPTVLLVDDSATWREALSAALAREGYDVVTAATGEEGLRRAAHLMPSIILVDGHLPDIDGAIVIRRLRLDAALRHIPCLLVTGSEDERAELRALDAGADAFLRKESDLSLVLARIAATLRSSAIRSANYGASLSGPKRVLAVDDSATYLHELGAELHGEGYDVILARSGEEALDLLAVQSVDVVLLDVIMPGIGGSVCCRRIKDAPGLRDTPVVMLTALDGPDAVLEGLSAGADDFITKSSDFEILRARVRAQLRRRQLEDEARRFRAQLARIERESAEARAANELAETRAGLVAELERKNRELEAFSYSVSHDLRAPLRTIEGFSQALLEDHADQLDAAGRDYLMRVRRAADRMVELIEALLRLARVGTGELSPELVDLSFLARDVAADLELGDPGRTVDFTIEPGLVAHCDPRLMRIVLVNLLGNAWKFTKGVATPEVRFGMTPDAEGRPVYFVADNGVGFAMSRASKLFAPFSRLHSTEDYPGTGVGLATVARIVERHGGRIQVDSAPSRGATFSWTLGEPGRNAP